MIGPRFIPMAVCPFLSMRRTGRAGLCVMAVPLVLVWSGSALAAGGESGGSGASGVSSSGPSTRSGKSSNSGTPSTTGAGDYHEDTRPVVTGNNSPGWNLSLGGPGTSNPLGFAQGFAPRGCALAPYPSGVGSGTETRSVLKRPSGPRRGSSKRYLQLSVTGTETYSDNVGLDSSHQKSDFITTVAPRLDACSSTGRIRGQLSYRLQGVVYANHGSDDDIYNDVTGNTTIDLITNHLYLDVNTEYGQQVIDPSIGYSRSNIIRPNTNKTSSWRTNVSPYLIQSLGLLGQGMLRYRYGHSQYGDSDVRDTNVQGVSASISSPDTVEPISWQAQAVSQWVNYSGGDQQDFFEQYRAYRELFNNYLGEDVIPESRYRDPDKTRHFDSASLQLGYHITREIQLTALGGIEDRHRQNGENDRWSAPRWQVGVRWANASNSLAVHYGHRFYGASYMLSAAHHGRLFDVTLTYNEQPSSPGLDGLDSAGSGYGFGTVGSIGNMLGGYGGYGGSGGGYGTNSLFDRGTYIRKRWRARIDFDTALTHTNITGFVRREDYRSDFENDTRNHGVEMDTRYDLGPRTGLAPSFRWEHYSGSFGDNADSDNYEAGIALVRSIAHSAKAAISYSRNWRDDNNGFGYQENRIALQFRKAF